MLTYEKHRFYAIYCVVLDTWHRAMIYFKHTKLCVVMTLRGDTAKWLLRGQIRATHILNFKDIL